MENLAYIDMVCRVSLTTLRKLIKWRTKKVQKMKTICNSIFIQCPASGVWFISCFPKSHQKWSQWKGGQWKPFMQRGDREKGWEVPNYTSTGLKMHFLVNSCIIFLFKEISVGSRLQHNTAYSCHVMFDLSALEWLKQR